QRNDKAQNAARTMFRAVMRMMYFPGLRAISLVGGRSALGEWGEREPCQVSAISSARSRKQPAPIHLFLKPATWYLTEDGPNPPGKDADSCGTSCLAFSRD